MFSVLVGFTEPKATSILNMLQSSHYNFHKIDIFSWQNIHYLYPAPFLKVINFEVIQYTLFVSRHAVLGLTSEYLNLLYENTRFMAVGPQTAKLLNDLGYIVYYDENHLGQKVALSSIVDLSRVCIVHSKQPELLKQEPTMPTYLESYDVTSPDHNDILKLPDYDVCILGSSLGMANARPYLEQLPKFTTYLTVCNDKMKWMAKQLGFIESNLIELDDFQDAMIVNKIIKKLNEKGRQQNEKI